MTIRWERPTTGEPVVYYILQILDYDLGRPVEYEVQAVPGTEQSYEFTYKPGTIYRVRVRGIDSRNREGEWSDWTDRWTGS